MAIQTSSDLQKIVLTAILNDSNLLGSIIDDMKDSFFSSNNYQFLYKVIAQYYKAYHKVPTEPELHFLLKRDYKPELGNLSEIIADTTEVLNAQISNVPFVLASIETFVKRAKFEELISDAAQKSTSDKTYTIDGIMEDFLQAYDYQVTDVKAMRLDDFSMYSEIREELFGSIDQNKIIKSSFPTLNQHLTYKGYKPTDLVTVVAAPGTGKTSFLINEGLAASFQGFNVFHVYLGDMNEITAGNRYMARLTGMPIDTYALHPENYNNVLMNDPRIKTMKIFNRIFTTRFAPGEMSVDKLRAIINKLQDKYEVHFDMIIIDYADNFAEEHEALYQNGGKIYDKLKAIAVNNRCVVLTASQPKNAYYDEEVIPFSGIAESSKKLHIVDITLTIGKIKREADIATMLLAKIREGTTGEWIRLKLELAQQKISEMSETDYAVRKNELYDIANAAGFGEPKKSNYKGKEDR